MNKARNTFHFICSGFLHLFNLFQQGYEYSFYLCERIKICIYVGTKKTENNRDEPSYGRRIQGSR